MPICPRCSATIHTGADDQCPACGYSLLRANDIFGDRQVEFTRVLDEAGALTHQERMELIHRLEQLERNIPPVALCVYITDNGQIQHMRTHAHWILNHARIHHPSFGKREQHKAIEDAELRERRPGDVAEISSSQQEGSWAGRVLSSITGLWRDVFRPYAPPVRQEWMLVLVMDVQLETACFSWGYMLDPYINPDSINSSIIRARLQFRERDMISGLKKVMSHAARTIAIDGRGISRRIRRRMAQVTTQQLPLWLGGMAVSLLAGSVSPAQETPPAAEPGLLLLQDDTAEEVPPEEATPAPAPAAPADAAPQPAAPQQPAADAPQPPAPAEQPSADAAQQPEPAPEPEPEPRIGHAPRWSAEHYRLLMTGELATGYVSLFPAPPEPVKEEEEEKGKKKAEKNKKEKRVEKPQPAPRPRVPKEEPESDKKVPDKYHSAYMAESFSGLCDPQGLLSTMERNDVLFLLHELNTQARFHIYVTLFKGTQKIPKSMTTESFLTAAATRSNHAVMLRYCIGDPTSLEIAYKSVFDFSGASKEELPALEAEAEKTRREWLESTREAAASDGEGGVEGLMAAIRRISDNVTPKAADFRIAGPDNSVAVPNLRIQLRPEEEKEKNSMRQKLEEMFTDPANVPYLISMGVVVLLIVLTLIYYFTMRRSAATLVDTPPDLRLSSPYGAGVSRYVRYLEGKEASREKRLF